MRPEPESFFDILEERRRGSDISHALRTFSPQPYRGPPPPSVSELNKTVLESQYLRYIISEMALETGEPSESLMEEAAGILEEMSQNLQLRFIRLMGFVLSKIFKRLFSSISVNEDGLARLHQAIQEHPLVLMPNHRSYIDFLILSYILFTYDLPVPVIAAGIPLMGLPLISEILRRSGAFFIRRAIGSDRIYWAVLSEYVRTIVRTEFAPLEFFVEGQRSRTLKSLSPRLGMMQMILEPFVKEEVYDITLVPVSISYDRVLEESLLAHELLGVPKPKESVRNRLFLISIPKCKGAAAAHTCPSLQDWVKCRQHVIPRSFPIHFSAFWSKSSHSASFHVTATRLDQGTLVSSCGNVSLLWQEDGTEGLLKARSVLEEDYGCMHVFFGKPVSVRELAKGRIKRGQYNLVPRSLPVRLSEDQQQFVGAVAHLLVRLQEVNMVLSPFSLMALVLLQRPLGEDWHLLASKTLWLRSLALQLRARLHWPAGVSDLEVLSSSLAVHRSVARCKKGRVFLVEEAGPGPVRQEEAVLRRASAVLMCASYRNQALHVFTRPAMLAAAMTTSHNARRDVIFRHFCFLRELFANEFIFIPGQDVQDFEQSCSDLQQYGAVSITNQELRVVEEEQDTLVFLSSIIQPFIESYQVVCGILCEERFQVFAEKSFVPDVRSNALKLLMAGEVQSYECLSADTQRNVLSALLRMGAATKSRVADHHEYRVNKAAVRRIRERLGEIGTADVSSYSRL